MAIQGEAIVSLECVLPLNSDILKSHLQLISREGSDTKGGQGWSSEGIPPPPGLKSPHSLPLIYYRFLYK